MKQKELIGAICPYCDKPPQLLGSQEVYGEDTNYGLIWACLPCQAWVGCHRGTQIPLGRLANKELRTWKQEAHFWFDPLWKKKVEQGLSKSKARKATYQYLADSMNIPFDLCHIGMFDVEQCKKVVEICKQWYRINHYKNTTNAKEKEI